jgi:RNA polymerase subunit RPABC4/transcription elongation factor Spt4
MSDNVNFGGGRSRAMEYVLIGSLGLIIVCCLAYAGYQIFGHGGSTTGNVAGDIHFKCTKEGCGYEFNMTEAELRHAEQENRMQYDPMRGNIRVKCPKCGEVSARQMTQCPVCHGWYLGPDPSLRGPKGQATPSPQPDSSKCPLCGVDLVEWYNKEYEKQHGH